MGYLQLRMPTVEINLTLLCSIEHPENMRRPPTSYGDYTVRQMSLVTCQSTITLSCPDLWM